MAKTINTRMSQKHDIEANWLKATNFTPLMGEIIIYRAEVEGDELPAGRADRITYDRMKIGNGVDTVNDLEFFKTVETSETTEGWGAMEIGDATSYGVRWLGAESIPEIENLPIAESLDIFTCRDNTGYEGTFSIWFYDDMGQRIYQTFPGINGAVDSFGLDFHDSWQQLLKEDPSNAFGYMDPPEMLGITSIEITWIADWAKPYLEIWKEIPVEDHYVSYKPQNLTEDQKAQVRENIGVNDIKIDQAVVAGEGEYSVMIDGSYEGVTNEAKGQASVALGGGVKSNSDGAMAEGVLNTAGRITQADATN